jgi:RecA-family ATPase
MSELQFDENGFYIPQPPGLYPVADEPKLADLLLTTRQLSNIPEPTPLIDGYLYRDCLVWLGGAPGAYKSFWAMEIACHVATGTTWRGARIKPGSVLYVVAEGKGGAWKRIEAWQAANRVEAQITWLPVAPQVSTRQWDELVQIARDRHFDLIVIDTQSRVTVGRDENQAESASLIVNAFTRLKDASGACVILVHHLNRLGTNLRGSSAIDGAAEAIVQLVKVDGVTRVRNKKQKDMAEFDDYYVRGVSSARSLVLVECDHPPGWNAAYKALRRGDSV